jgi:ribosome biogenesis GTPase A
MTNKHTKWWGQASFEYKPRQRESRLERQRKNEMLKGMGGGVTASFLPGTTLGITELDLGNGRSMFDTPGLIVPSQLTNRLEMEELAAVLPQKRVEHVTYRLNPGSCVHLGGLAYVELVDAPGARAFFFTIFVSNLISLHVGKADKASAFREQHVGQGKILSPPFRVERVQELGELVPSMHTAEGDSWATACVDIVVSGLGWVAVTGLGPVTIRTWAPPGIEVIAQTIAHAPMTGCTWRQLSPHLLRDPPPPRPTSSPTCL